MNISKKIDEIREQPLHVRMRWVWGCVGLSMLIIFAVWIISMNSLFQSSNKSEDVPTGGIDGLKAQLQELQDQAPALKSLTDQQLTVGQENFSDNSNEFQYPDSTSLPQSATYENLPGAQGQ